MTQRVLLITACGAMREHQIPERDLGQDIIVPLMRRVPAMSWLGRPEEDVSIYKRRFVYDGEFYGRTRQELIYREEL
jgi:hypothetical protein